jgi:predicted RNase H-like HicB family nuclease
METTDTTESGAVSTTRFRKTGQCALTRIAFSRILKMSVRKETATDKSSYTFPALFSYADDGITITFPDLPGCTSEAESDDEAMRNATEALELWLASNELDGESIPEPTHLLDVKTGGDERAVLVVADMERAMREIRPRYVRKNLTIPEWLNKRASEAGINFSQVLQEALKDRLGAA